MKATKYRIVNSGYNHYIQYKGWILWHFVPLPNYQYYVGEDRYITLYGYPLGTDDYIGGSKSQCKEFAEKYPNIKDYFRDNYNPKQEKLKAKVIAEHNAREELTKKVFYL